MFNGMPMELITLGVSTIGSAVTALFSQSMKMKQFNHQMLMARSKWQAEAIQQAREYKGPGVNFTRRTIAIMIVFAVIFLPKIAAVLAAWTGIDLPVLVGYTQFNPGFLFLTEGHEVIKWQPSSGLVWTPLDTHACMAVIGFYFGPSIVKNA